MYEKSLDPVVAHGRVRVQVPGCRGGRAAARACTAGAPSAAEVEFSPASLPTPPTPSPGPRRGPGPKKEIPAHAQARCPAPKMGTFRRHTKMEVCEHFLDNLRQRPELGLGPAELEGIKLHFKGMPTRYALDVNTATMDVLNHKRLLDCAREDAGAVSFQVRCVNVLLGRNGADSGNYSPVGQAMDVSSEQVRILFQTPPPPTHTGVATRVRAGIALPQRACARPVTLAWITYSY